MSAFDYMNLVSGYIFNIFENKKDLNESISFIIKPIRDPYTAELFYEVKEKVNFSNQVFYLKFPCKNKEDFYNAVRMLIIEYINNSKLLLYTATNSDNSVNNVFTIVTNTRANLNFILEDETDILVFNQFKEYLDMKLRNNTYEEKVEEDISNILAKKYEKTTTSSKIML